MKFTVNTPDGKMVYPTDCESTAFGVALDEARALPSGDVEVRREGVRIGAYRAGRFPSKVA